MNIKNSQSIHIFGNVCQGIIVCVYGDKASLEPNLSSLYNVEHEQ